MTEGRQSALPGELLRAMDSLRDEQVARRAAVASARLAISRTELLDARATHALEEHDGTAAPEATLAAMSALSQELDIRAWDLQESVDAGLAEPAAYELAFAQARASTALQYALGPDAVTDAAEAIYEAHHAIQDATALAAVIRGAAGDDG